MSESQVSSGDDTKASGEGEQPTNSENKVSRESYLKAVDEAKKAKARAADLEARQKKLDEDKLREQGEYKKLLEDREKDLKKAAATIEQFRQKEINGKKLMAFEEKLGGKLRSKDFLSMVDLSRISYDEQSESVDLKTVESVASDFMQKFDYLIEKPTARLPGDAAAAAKSLTYEQWKEIKDPKEMREKMKYVKF